MKTKIELNQLKEYLIFNNIKEKDISLFLERISLHKYQTNDIKIDSNDSAFTYGEISLFNKDKRRTATVKANSECSIGKLKFTDLSEICNKNTKVGYQIMKNVGEIITKQLVRSNNNVLKLTTAFGLMIDK